MKFTVVTLFPKLIEGYLSEGLVATGVARGLLAVDTLNPRAFTSDVHGTVDDRAFGGGDGMVMKPEPLAAAVESLRKSDPSGTGQVRVAVLTPQGRVWNQSVAREYAEAGGHVALVCGRYAGIDQRFVAEYADDEISLGDFILNGGELAALAIVESVARLIPGVLGNRESAAKDSFSKGLLEAPQFTRPREWQGHSVPAPLLSGNHAEIEAFKNTLSVLRTLKLRPDLLRGLSEADRRVLGLDV